MKYFAECKTLDELKKEFRRLAMLHHPDRGGDTETMQKINEEYEALFPKLKLMFNQTAAEPTHETADSYRRDFYTQNGWCGKNFDSRISTKEITARIREYVKKTYSDCKFSVRFHSYAGGSTIHVSLMEGPYPALKEDGYAQINEYYIDKDTKMTEWGKAVMIDVNDFIKSYRYSDCDGMIDYFDVNFWYDIDVGSWSKPYKLNNKTKKISGEGKKGDSSNGAIRVVYNEEHNGVELYFDIKPDADTLVGLKTNGFKWHHTKKCWFIKKSEEALKFIGNLNPTLSLA